MFDIYILILGSIEDEHARARVESDAQRNVPRARASQEHADDHLLAVRR